MNIQLRENFLNSYPRSQAVRISPKKCRKIEGRKEHLGHQSNIMVVKRLNKKSSGRGQRIPRQEQEWFTKDSSKRNNKKTSNRKEINIQKLLN
jgi:hypothetical protein